MRRQSWARQQARAEARLLFAHEAMRLDDTTAAEAASRFTREMLIKEVRKWGLETGVSVRYLVARLRLFPIEL